MQRLTTRLWRMCLSVGLLVGLALLAASCGEDEQAQAVADQAVAQDAEEAQESEQSSSATTQTQPAAQPQQQEDPEATVSVERQSTESVEQQAEPEPSDQGQQPQQQQQAAQTGDATSDALGQEEDGSSQAVPQQQAQQSQQAEQAMLAESVPVGTRLITLFGDITEIVYALGAQEYLLARDASSIYPPEAEELPNLGFAGGLNAEAILEFEPTLVIGTPMAGPPGVLEQLRQAGVEVLILEEMNGLDAPQVKIRIIGETLGIPQKAETLALDVEKRLATVMAAAEENKPLRVLHVYFRRGGLQLVSGEGNKAQTIIEAAGGIDAAAEAGIVGWQPLTPEALVAADPEVYLVMDRGIAVIGGLEGLMAIPGIAETKAGRGQYIISMPDLLLLGFGPRLPEAIADLSEYIQLLQAEILNE